MWRHSRANLIRTIALLMSVVVFLALLPSLAQVGGPGPLAMNLATHAYVLAWLMLLTLPVRSIGSREVLVAFFLGMFLIPGFVFLIGTPIRSWLADDPHTLAIIWAPLLEETGLLLAVAILAFRLVRRSAGPPGLADLFVLGFAVGAGYAIHEDALYGRFQPGWHTTFATVFDGAYGWAYPTFSDMTFGFSTYHGAHGAFLGLAVAIAVLLVSRARWVAAVVPVAWAYSVVDHAAANWQVSYGDVWFGVAVANGHAIALVVLLAPAVLLVVELVRRRRSTVPLPTPTIWLVVNLVRYSGGPLDAAARLLMAAGYHRTRNAMTNAAWREPDAPITDTALAESMLVLAIDGIGDGARAAADRAAPS